MSPSLESIVFSRYQSIRTLGAGAFADVFLVNDLRSGRMMALKCLRRAEASSEASRLFLEEFERLKGLEHPHIIAVYDLISDDDTWAYSMEYVDGKGLAELQSTLTSLDILAMASQLLSALLAIEDRGLVHGDISPDNIFICQNNGVLEAKVIDLGLATAIGEVGTRGTPAYMAPELFQGQGCDGRSDLYSLGVVLLECFLGQRAFDAEDIDRLIQQKLVGPQGQLAALRERVSPEIYAFIAGLLEANPARRPRNIQEARSQLLDLKEQASALDFPVDGLRLGPRPLVGRQRFIEQCLSMAQSVRLTEEGRLFWLEGEEGSGRRRMGQELKTQLQLQGWNPLHWHSVEGTPYALIRGILPPALVEHCLRPEIRAAHPLATRFLKAGGDKLPDGLESADLAESLAAVLLEALQGRYSAWVLKLVGPQDSAGLATLGRLLLKLRQVPLLVILVVDGAQALNGPLADLKGILRDEKLIDAEDSLQAYTADEIGSLLGGTFGEMGKVDRLAAEIHRLSAGNAWVVDNLLLQMVRSGAVERQASGWLVDLQRVFVELEELPASRMAQIEARLAALPEPSRALLGHLVLWNQGLERALWRERLSPAQVDGALDPLLDAGYIREVGGIVYPPSGLVQAAVLKGLKPSAQRAIHQSFIDACEKEDGLGLEPRRFITHLLGAGDGRALDVGMDLVEAYLDELAYEPANALIQKLRQVGENPPLLLAQARCFEELGDYAAAAQVLSQLAQAGYIGPADAAQPSAEAAFYRRLASARYRTGDLKGAEEAIGRSLTLLGDEQGARLDRLETAHDQAMILQFRGEAQQAKKCLIRALRLVGLQGPLDGSAKVLILPALEDGQLAQVALRILHLLGAVHWQLGEHDEAELWLSKGFHVVDVPVEALFTSTIAPGPAGPGEANICLVLGSIARHKGEFPQAIRLITRAADFYEASGRHRAAARCFNNLGIVQMQLGKWSEAIRLWERFLYLCDRVGDHADHATALNNLGSAYREQGRLELARRRLIQARERAVAAGYRRLQGLVEGNLGEVAHREGKNDEARTYYLNSIAIAQEAQAKDDEVEGRRRLLELDLSDGQAFDFKAWQSALTLAKESKSSLEAGNLLGLGGAQSVLNGDEQAGLAHLEAGLELLSSIGAVFERARLELRFAEALYFVGKYVEADRMLGEAQDRFEKLGARYDLQACQSLSQRLELQAPGVSDSRKNLQLLLEVNRDLAQVLDLERLMALIVKHALNISHAERGFIILFDEAGRATFKAAEQMGHEEVDLAGSQISSTMVKQVLETKKAVAVTNVRDNMALRDQKSVLSLGLRTIMAAPMIRSDRVIGLIYVDSSYVTRTFHSKDLRLMEALAEAAGVAVENALRYEALKRKTDMMYFMAHEFRSPLTAVLSFADLLLMEKESFREDHGEFLGIISEQGRRLSRMVSSVLELAKMEANQVEFQMQPVDLKALIDSTLRALHPLASEKSIGVHGEVGANLPIVFGNYDRLVQVLTNLVSNACKFTPEGGNIWVRCTPIPIPERPGDEMAGGGGAWSRRTPVPGQKLSESQCLRIVVDDDGGGMDPRALDYIFDKFSQEGGIEKRAKGTGLGLAIAKEIVEQHGGRIWAENREAGGARFAFILPVVEGDQDQG